MSQSKQPSGFPGPNMMTGYWGMFNAYVGSMEPLARNAARVNCELTSLAGQRASAYLTIPEQLSRCRTPQDIFQAQMAFWQQAQKHYVEATGRMMAVWRDTSEAVAEQSAGLVVPRDFITFPEPQTGGATGRPDRQGERRAA